MESLVWLDPSTGTRNAGDLVIGQSIERLGLSGLSTSPRITTHRHPDLHELRRLRKSKTILVGGTNILASHMERHRQWFVSPAVAAAVWGKCVFLGVGWWQYQEEACAYTRWLLKGIAKQTATHSARDAYTTRRLSSLGLHVLMTGCPTMWSLPGTIEQPHASEAVVTVTDYHQRLEVDRNWIRLVADQYPRISIVGMGSGDAKYVEMLRVLDDPHISYVGDGLDALDAALQNEVEFIGTRLHAGIRALQFGRRALILSVDNRAVEIAATSGLPMIAREDFGRIGDWLGADQQHLHLSMPVDAIDSWRRSWKVAGKPSDINDRDDLRVVEDYQQNHDRA